MAATRAPLYDRLQQIEEQGRRTPPFDLMAENDPIARVVQLYEENAVDARVAATELGLETVENLDARWSDNADLRHVLDQSVPRSRWSGQRVWLRR